MPSVSWDQELRTCLRFLWMKLVLGLEDCLLLFKLSPKVFLVVYCWAYYSQSCIIQPSLKSRAISWAYSRCQAIYFSLPTCMNFIDSIPCLGGCYCSISSISCWRSSTPSRQFSSSSSQLRSQLSWLFFSSCWCRMALTYFRASWTDSLLCFPKRRSALMWLFLDLCLRLILSSMYLFFCFSMCSLFSSPSSYSTRLASSLFFCLFFIRWQSLLFIFAILLFLISWLNWAVRCRLASCSLYFASYLDSLAKASSSFFMTAFWLERSIDWSFWSIFLWRVLMGLEGRKLMLAALSLSLWVRSRVSFSLLCLTIPTHLSIQACVFRQVLSLWIFSCYRRGRDYTFREGAAMNSSVALLT